MLSSRAIQDFFYYKIIGIHPSPTSLDHSFNFFFFFVFQLRIEFLGVHGEVGFNNGVLKR